MYRPSNGRNNFDSKVLFGEYKFKFNLWEDTLGQGERRKEKGERRKVKGERRRRRTYFSFLCICAYVVLASALLLAWS
jgi:hypothetical protein